MEAQPGLEVFQWEGQGYQPLIFSQDWQVAQLNWEPLFDLEKLGEIERHNHTNEVFVLVRGRALLFTLTDGGYMQAEDMVSNVLYNVTQGSWHNLLATRDATWIIVEKRDTHLNDTEFRQLTQSEAAWLQARLPGWIK
jgi:hypothetical protein